MATQIHRTRAVLSATHTANLHVFLINSLQNKADFNKFSEATCKSVEVTHSKKKKSHKPPFGLPDNTSLQCPCHHSLT